MSPEVSNPFLEKQSSGPVPESEIQIDFARSGGPGGQNVNKTETKAQLRWNIEASHAFSDSQKARLKKALEKRLTKTGEIVLSSESERSQNQNRDAVIERLQSIVQSALTPKKKRIPTKPTRSAKERRLKEKKKQSRKKRLRKVKPEDE